MSAILTLHKSNTNVPNYHGTNCINISTLLFGYILRSGHLERILDLLINNNVVNCHVSNTMDCFLDSNKWLPLRVEASEILKAIYVWTVKSVYKDHSRDPKIVSLVDMWSFFKGTFHVFYIYALKLDPKIMVAVGRWSLARVLTVYSDQCCLT